MPFNSSILLAGRRFAKSPVVSPPYSARPQNSEEETAGWVVFALIMVGLVAVLCVCVVVGAGMMANAYRAKLHAQSIDESTPLTTGSVNPSA